MGIALSQSCLLRDDALPPNNLGIYVRHHFMINIINNFHTLLVICILFLMPVLYRAMPLATVVASSLWPFKHLFSSWWRRFRRLRRYGFAGGRVSPGVGFKTLKPCLTSS